MARVGERESRTFGRRSLGKVTSWKRKRWEYSIQEERRRRACNQIRALRDAQEALERQAKALAQRRGVSLEDARQAVSDTEAGRQLKDLADGEHRHERAQEWQASVFWDRAEERLMHLYASEALSRIAAEHHYSWLEGYMEWLEGKEERAQYYTLLEEELASLRG